MQTALCAVIIALFLILTEYADLRKEKVKEMAEYIERKAAIDVIMSEPTDAHYPSWYADKIKSISASDVAPVRHGVWEWIDPNRLTNDCMCGTCSICKVRSKYIVNKEIFPNCGAKMDGENNE